LSGSRRNQAVQSELVRHPGDSLTGGVRSSILGAGTEHIHRQAAPSPRTCLAEIENVGDLDLSGHQQSRRKVPSEFGRILGIHDGVDEMPVRLNGDGDERLT
jgi:hypothetical protein